MVLLSWLVDGEVKRRSPFIFLMRRRWRNCTHWSLVRPLAGILQIQRYCQFIQYINWKLAFWDLIWRRMMMRYFYSYSDLVIKSDEGIAPIGLWALADMHMWCVKYENHQWIWNTWYKMFMICSIKMFMTYNIWNMKYAIWWKLPWILSWSGVVLLLNNSFFWTMSNSTLYHCRTKLTRFSILNFAWLQAVVLWSVQDKIHGSIEYEIWNAYVRWKCLHTQGPSGKQKPLFWRYLRSF